MNFLERMANDLASFAGTLNMQQWAILSVVTCVVGYMMLRGSNLRGG